MTTEAAAKKDTQKLQRAIIDGLEDVKAQDIQVFDTEHLSPLFERVIVASGTSTPTSMTVVATSRRVWPFLNALMAWSFSSDVMRP